MERSETMRKKLIALAIFFLVLSYDVFAIEVGSIADSRFGGDGWTLDGDEMTETRAKLLASANFGPGGTVPEAINITDVADTITFAVLSEFDVFFIGYFYFDHENAFTVDELQAFQDWVSAGGTMVVTCDEPEYDAVCTAFGPVPGFTSAAPPVAPTIAGSGSPVFDGPFGAPSALLMAGSQYIFEETGGFTVLGEDQNGGPVVLERLLGDGRVVFFTDVDMVSNDTLSAGSGISDDNDRFLGNVFAYLASEAVNTFDLNAGLNGNWWFGPGRSGEGMQLELSDGGGGDLTMVATFYSYDTSGNQIFLIAVGTTNGDSVDVDVYITEGGLWGAAFNPALVNESEWGTGMISASNCESIHMVLTPNATYQALGYTALEYDLVRLTVPWAPCPIANP